MQPVNRKRGGCHINSGDTTFFYATQRTLNRAFIYWPAGAPCVESSVIFTVQCGKTTMGKKRSGEMDALQSGGKANASLRDGIRY